MSDTGQLKWDLRRPGHGVVTVDTPRSKAVVGYGGGHRYELGGLVIEPGQTRQDGWSARTLTAMEGDLATAPSRWLITATGYVENTDMGWKDAEHTSVGSNWGSRRRWWRAFRQVERAFTVTTWRSGRWTSRSATGHRALPSGPGRSCGNRDRTGMADAVVRGRGPSSEALRKWFQPLILNKGPGLFLVLLRGPHEHPHRGNRSVIGDGRAAPASHGAVPQNALGCPDAASASDGGPGGRYAWHTGLTDGVASPLSLGLFQIPYSLLSVPGRTLAAGRNSCRCRGVSNLCWPRQEQEWPHRRRCWPGRC